MKATKIAVTNTTLAAAFAAGISLFTPNARAADDWKDELISPVANPIYFEDPRITTEARPIFMEHFLPQQFKVAGGSLPLGGDVQVYALQLRAALTDRLAFIATKDGYIVFHPNHSYPGANVAPRNGWADIAAGLKYALVEKPDEQFLLTPGFTVTLPTGNEGVYQGRGDGEENLFVSAVKGWDNFHVTGNLGFRIPNNFAKETAQVHYSFQADYQLCRYFIPFVVMNGYTILSSAKSEAIPVGLTAEGYDLINFGATQAKGSTQWTAGCGFRSKLAKHVDLGFAYEAGMSDPDGIFESRITTDLIIRF